jgi:hypothetical protein
MALDASTRIGRDGKEIPLDLADGTPVFLQGYSKPIEVEFVEWTTEVAMPREGGAVARIAYRDGVTDTRVAGELTLE